LKGEAEPGQTNSFAMRMRIRIRFDDKMLNRGSASTAAMDRWLCSAVVVLALLLISLIPVRGDETASCVAKMSAYVAELDELLSNERNWITPFDRLNKKFFPFVDCDADPLLEEASRSRFFQHIIYYPRAKEYYVRFASSDVKIGFAYLIKERRTKEVTALFVNK
jgi:hypothetical protein